MQVKHGNNPFQFDFWANPFAHPLLLKPLIQFQQQIDWHFQQGVIGQLFTQYQSAQISESHPFVSHCSFPSPRRGLLQHPLVRLRWAIDRVHHLLRIHHSLYCRLGRYRASTTFLPLSILLSQRRLQCDQIGLFLKGHFKK